MKKIQIRYLIYGLLVLSLIFLDKYAITQNQMFAKANYESSDMLLLLGMMAKMAIGAVLAMEYLYKERMKSGKWRARSGLLLFAVLPSFYLANPYFAKSSIAILSAIHLLFLRPNYMNYLAIFQILFGYLLIKSFYKEERKG